MRNLLLLIIIFMIAISLSCSQQSYMPKRAISRAPAQMRATEKKAEKESAQLQELPSESGAEGQKVEKGYGADMASPMDSEKAAPSLPAPSVGFDEKPKETDDFSYMKSRSEEPEPRAEHFEIQESVDETGELLLEDKVGFIGAEAPSGLNARVPAKESAKKEMGGGADRKEKEAEEEKEKSEGKALLESFRVRSRFPEVLYFNPQIITNESGESIINLPSTDSISTYDIDVFAATQKGEWGRGSKSFKTFKNLFIDFTPPSKLRAGDVVNLSAALFNYTDKTLNLETTITTGGVLKLEGAWRKKITIQPSKAVELKFKVKAESHGVGNVIISSSGDKISDAINRMIEVMPSEPEVRVNIGGFLKKGKNNIEIPIPKDAIMWNEWSKASDIPSASMAPLFHQPDVWLRIYNNPAFGALKLAEEISREPHASLARSTAFMESVILMKRKADELTPSQKKEYENYFQQQLDIGWCRILAFRTADGFSLFPMEKAEPFADLVVLEIMNQLQNAIVNDKDLLKFLEDRAYTFMLDESQNKSDRLYAASLIVDSPNILPVKKQKMTLLLNSISHLERNDLLVSVLAAKIASSLGLENLKAPFESVLPRLVKDATQKDYSSGSTAGAFRGGAYPFALALILETQLGDSILRDDALKSSIRNKLMSIYCDKGSPALEMVDSMKALNHFEMEISNDKLIKSILLNGKRVYGSNLSKPAMGLISTELNLFGSPVEIPLDLKPGKNNLVIESTFPYLAYQVVGKYYARGEVSSQTPGIDFKIPENISDDGIFHAELDISTSKTFDGRGAILRIPLPPGVKPIDSPRALARRVAADYAEIRENEIIFYFKELRSHANLSFVLPMYSGLRGDFTISPPYMESDVSGILGSTGKSQNIKWL